MSNRLAARRTPVLTGILCTGAAWFVFALQDAGIKLLVADLTAWQVLFARSVTILALCLLLGPRGSLMAGLTSPARLRLFGCSLIYAAAWLAYYTAARYLTLAELETIYYASPVIATMLAVLLLQESVPLRRWATLGVGFAGVLLACGASAPTHREAIWLALLAAALWAYTVVSIRQLAHAEPTSVQMLVGNLTFLVACGIAMPWWWQPVSPVQLGLMLMTGLCGAAGQFLIYEGIKRAPASVVAPLEYTGLAWSFSLGFAIWGDVPVTSVFVGAGLIVVSGLFLIVDEWRSSSRPAAET